MKSDVSGLCSKCLINNIFEGFAELVVQNCLLTLIHNRYSERFCFLRAHIHRVQGGESRLLLDCDGFLIAGQRRKSYFRLRYFLNRLNRAFEERYELVREIFEWGEQFNGIWTGFKLLKWGKHKWVLNCRLAFRVSFYILTVGAFSVFWALDARLKAFTILL
jgi:hypothetical protein